jgi:asparagine synthase (glutamine-hydrolysing)
MADLVRHRGPDDEGYVFIDPSSARSVALAGDDTTEDIFQHEFKYAPTQFIQSWLGRHSVYRLGMMARRLSILDLSPAGHQPMCNDDGTVWIVHNGEIYNYQEIRKELQSKGYRFVSNTDTEVILHAYQEWGPLCLHKFNGMWAFSIWDARHHLLFCACDRFGIKPFYYFYDRDVFAFASEIKAILGSGMVGRVPNDEIIYDYLVHGLVDHRDETFFRGINRLRGGHWLSISEGAGAPTVQCYYDIREKQEPLELLSDDEYARRFYGLFEDSIRLRLISDVPVGTCLSGGLDSSSIACVVNRVKREQSRAAREEDFQKVFTACFEEYDESRFALEVAERIAAEAHWISPTAEAFAQELDNLMWHQEEPFDFIGAYAQWCVFKLIHQTGIKVTLDGQGGDELLAGYYRDYISELLMDLLSEFRLKRLFEELVAFNLVYNPKVYGIPKSKTLYLATRLPRWAYRSVVSHARRRLGSEDRSASWLRPEFAAQVGRREIFQYQQSSTRFERQSYERFMLNGLPALLRLADKSSMAHSVESRTPFLDYRLVEFLFSIPREQKIRNGVTKCVLRKAMKGILPEVIRSRPDKMGFYPRFDSWLRNELRSLITEILTSQRFQERPYVDPAEVVREVDSYLQGNTNISRYLWRWINLELWMRRFIDRSC